MLKLSLFLLGLILGLLLYHVGALLLGDASPPPCLGQRWRLRGVGTVEIVGLRVWTALGTIATVEYAYPGQGTGEPLKGAVPLGVFLASATLIEPTTEGP